MNKQDLVFRPIREIDIGAVQHFLLGQRQELFDQEVQNVFHL